MKKMQLILILLASPFLLISQSEESLVRATLMNYLNGSSYNDTAMIKSAFYEEADLFLHKDGQPLYVLDPETYSNFFTKRETGVFNGREGRVLFVDIEGVIAIAKAEVVIPAINRRFIDLFLLKKLEDGWKIISKSATAEPLDTYLQNAKAHPVKEVVMDGLRHPWSMQFINEEEVLLAEKDGDLLLINLQTKQRQSIAGFPDDLARPMLVRIADHPQGTFPGNADGKSLKYNAGIFQVLLDPEFKTNQTIYVSYAAEGEGGTATKVIRARLQAGQLTAVKTILLAAPFSGGLFHYGGGMVIGPDHMLYITVGDRQFSEVLQPSIPISQDVKDHRGKIYRFHLDGSIPADNPDFGSDAIPGLYALGIRASQGLTVEPATGRIWFSEHGTLQGDEVNVLAPGANYGWPIITSGRYRASTYDPPKMVRHFTDPTYFWLQTVAPTGLTFYTGNEFPQWKNNLIVPGLSRGSLWRMEVDGVKIKSVEELFIDDRVRCRKVVQSPAGTLYMLTDEEDGKIVRIRNQVDK